MSNFQLTIVAAGVVVASVFPAAAQLQIYEPFDYPTTGFTDEDGSFLGDGSQSGALGLSGSWSSEILTIEMEVRDESMTFTDGGGNELPVSGLSIRRSDRSGYTTNSIALEASAAAALTADNSTMWMSFLFEDEGFSGPDTSVMLASEPLGLFNNHSLSSAGYGVGILVGESSGNLVESGYYDNSTTTTRAQSTLAFNDVNDPPNNRENITFLLAAKINWNPDGAPDEIFVFNITDLTSEPAEIDAIVSDTFDMPLVAQQSLDTLNLGETQVDALDEIRVGHSFADVVGAGGVSAPLEIASWTALGGNVWEVEVSGSAGGQYIFQSADDLVFEAGDVVENLSQGDPGDAGTIGGTGNSILTLDENGSGLVQLTLAGGARGFIRAETAQ